MSFEKRILLRLVCACGLVTVGACTPIQAPSGRQNPQLEGGMGGIGSTMPLAARSGDSPSATQGGSCSPEGSRACTDGQPSRQPLRCESSTWAPQPTCNEGQRCDPEPGASQGSCVKIARECIGRTPDAEFCDGMDIRACAAGLSHVKRSCGADQRCVEQNDQARCECATGSIESGGSCVAGTRCDMGRGGCDMLTECKMDGATRTCTGCPLGFSGTGLIGCTPDLLELTSSSGALTPMLAAGTSAYRIRLPLLRAQLTLTPRAADGVDVEVNGQKLAAGAAWSSGMLSLGEHPLALTLTASNGASRRYEIIVERAGTQEAYVKPVDPDPDDAFGFSVAIDGDTMVIGAPSEDGAVGGINGDQKSDGSEDSGAAFVFVRQGSTWTQQAYLKADHPEAADYFGAGVAISGDTVLVGVPRSNPYPNNTASVPPRPGLVYVFSRRAGVWAKQTTIPSPSSSPDLFGYSIAMGKDTVVIGAPYDSEGDRSSGAVYVLPRTDSWGPLVKRRPKQPVYTGTFGWALALDGDNLLVGAPQNTLTMRGAGSAYMFTRGADGWQEQQKLPPDAAPEGATFGWSVSLQGELAAVGAPRAALIATTPRGEVYVYRRAGAQWTQANVLTAGIPRSSDYFGSSVVLAGDSLVAGVSGDTSSAKGLDADANRTDLVQAGGLYLFTHQGDDWVRATYLKSNNPDRNAMLGQTAVVSGDTLLSGAMNENSAASGVNAAPSGSAQGSGAAYVFR